MCHEEHFCSFGLPQSKDHSFPVLLVVYLRRWNQIACNGMEGYLQSIIAVRLFEMLS